MSAEIINLEDYREKKSNVEKCRIFTNDEEDLGLEELKVETKAVGDTIQIDYQTREIKKIKKMYITQNDYMYFIYVK